MFLDVSATWSWLVVLLTRAGSDILNTASVINSLFFSFSADHNIKNNHLWFWPLDRLLDLVDLIVGKPLCLCMLVVYSFHIVQKHFLLTAGMCSFDFLQVVIGWKARWKSFHTVLFSPPPVRDNFHFGCVKKKDSLSQIWCLYQHIRSDCQRWGFNLPSHALKLSALG